MLSGNVLITGGAGFLGRSILRQAKRYNWPVKFTVYSRDETKQWELKHAYPEVHCILGDISHDVDRLIAACHGHDTVIHAAAVKYIPEAEHNVFETIDVNILGSRNVAIAARAAGVKTVVGVSTDKACGPLNVYGMTKGIMERLFSEANRMGSTNFITVRYGNVVGSTGSVIPLFKRQVMEDNRIRLTNPTMTRFWLSVEKAVELIDLSANWASEYPGHTLVYPCSSMKIYDLAQAIWEMNKPGTEPIIQITGVRPGEKFHEALINEQEAPRTKVLKDHHLMLRPAVMPSLSPVEVSAYTSDHPNQWITNDEMISYIKDAENV